MNFGGDLVYIENGLLGIPSIKMRALAVYFGRFVRSWGVSWPGCLVICAARSTASPAPTWKVIIEANVAEDGVGSRVVELLEVLVGDGQVEAVFAGFAEDRGERAGGEVLELVDVEVDVGLLDGGDEEGSEQRGALSSPTRPLLRLMMRTFPLSIISRRLGSNNTRCRGG